MLQIQSKAHNRTHSGERPATHGQLKTCAAPPGLCWAAWAVSGISTRALLFKTAGRGTLGPYFITPFKSPITPQLLNGEACKSYIIHVEHSQKAQEHFSSPPTKARSDLDALQEGSMEVQ